MSPSADFLGVAEPVLRFEYEASFELLPEETLKFNQSITLPKSASEVNIVYYKNNVKTIAGKSKHETTTLKVRTFVSPKTAAKCWEWYRLAYPSPGKVGHPKTYKKPGTISLLNGRGEPISTWRWEGCWISNIEMGEGVQGQAEIIEVNLTIEYDEIVGPL